MSDRPRESLDTLPGETLLDIIDHYGSQGSIPTRDRMVYTLSHVNRRLHAFAQPLVLSDIVVPMYFKFVDAMAYFRNHNIHLADCVRFIRIGEMKPSAFQFYVTSGSIPSFDTFKCNITFPNLLSFQCMHAVCGEDTLQLLRASPLIETLVVAWRDIFSFPHLQYWPHLKSLRLYMYREDGTVRPDTFDIVKAPLSSASLTTLVIYDSYACQWWGNQAEALSFPSLRVLNINGATCSPRSVYHFIHRHPTLLEVNIHLPSISRPLTLEGLVKLIEGTGTWKRPNDGAISDFYHYDPYREDDSEDEIMVPEDKVDQLIYSSCAEEQTYITFNTFAFSRVPLSPAATQWNSRLGSEHPRYKTTALAILVHCQNDWDETDHDVTFIPDFFAFSQDMFPELEELRMDSGTFHMQYDTFVQFMEDIANHLPNWTSLRKLTLGWRIPGCWEWEDGDDSEEDDILDRMYPPMRLAGQTVMIDDEVEKPRGPDIAVPYTLNDYREVYTSGDAEMFEEELREVYGDDVDLEAHADDRSFLVRAWEMRHHDVVARMIRLFGSRCPTLEQVDWYPISTFAGGYRQIRWSWTIQREPGTLDVGTVSGKLTFFGSAQDHLMPLAILVGEELAVREKIESESANTVE